MRYAREFARWAVWLLVPSVVLSAVVTAQTIVGPTDLASRSLQSVVDEVPAGGILILEAGVYIANVVIDAPIAILGGPDVVLRPEDQSRPAISVRDTEDVLIQDLRIDRAGLGFEISGASCSIVGCSIATSEIGASFVSMGARVLIIRDCALRGKGVGIQTVGIGTALVSTCHIEMTGPGILVGGMTALSAVGCMITRCSDGIVATFGSDVFLRANILQANLRSGFRLSELPAVVAPIADGIVCAIDNRSVDNIHWGVVYTTGDGGTCGVPDRKIVGAGNTITGNGYGPVCPADLIPEGFLQVDESE